MQGRILLPGEVGSQIEPRLTWDGLRDFLGELRKKGQRIPTVILVSERDRRDLNQEILGHSSTPVAKEDQKEDHDGAAIGFIDGVMIRSSPEVAHGKARLIYPPVVDKSKPLPSGKIIVGGPLAT